MAAIKDEKTLHVKIGRPTPEDKFLSGVLGKAGLLSAIVYLAAVLNWFNRWMLYWHVSIMIEAEFCLDAVEGTCPLRSANA